MRYRDNSEKSFVVVNLDDNLKTSFGDKFKSIFKQGSDLKTAIDTIVSSDVYKYDGSSNNVHWYPDGVLSGEINDLVFENNLPPSDLIGVLKFIRDCNIRKIFIVGLDIVKESHLAEDLKSLLPDIVNPLQVENAPDNKFILVCVGGDPKELIPNFRYGKGEIIGDKILGPKPDNFRKFKNVVEQKQPDGNDKWPFADDEKWIEYIDNLEEDHIIQLVKEGTHLKPIKRVRDALVEVQSKFVRRNHALEIMVACAIARVNIVFLGPPGTAKSLMVRSFAQALGIRSESRNIKEENEAFDEAKDDNKRSGVSKRRMFEYLLTRYTTPEEIFGGANISVLLSAGVHGRRTDGMLPQAEIAFLDEIFKANSAILNTLLSITNERIFYNMGQAFKVDLAFIVGASNETPDEEELGALYDRFPIRVPCQSVKTKEDVKKVVSQAHSFETSKEFRGENSSIKRHACLNDLRLLSKIIQTMYGGSDELFGGNSLVEDLFFNIFLKIRNDYSVSDRTPIQILRLCRALALLEGETPAEKLEPKHLRAWGYVAPKLESSIDLQRFIKATIYNMGSSEVDLFDEN